MTETPLELFQQQQAKAKPSLQDERDIVRVLRLRAEMGLVANAQGKPSNIRWVSCKDLCSMLEWPASETSERRVRKAIAENSKRILSGDKGYCLLSSATMEEVQHAAARLRTHGEAEIQRSVDLLNAFHNFGRERA